MSIKDFTEKEVKVLSKNKYVTKVSIKGITYTDEYKHIFIAENEKGKSIKEIFKEYGFDIDVLGTVRIRSAAYRWRTAYRKKGIIGLNDTRKLMCGRIMKKYQIVCPIRKANPYRRMMKATLEHAVLPNLLNRNFKQNIPGKVLLTDITYLFYGKGNRAYLSTIKDASTNEILAYNVSANIKMDIATDTILKLKKNSDIKISKDAFIHSDQGCHVRQEVA